jgi:protein-tyrosine phosphatase
LKPPFLPPRKFWPTFWVFLIGYCLVSFFRLPRVARGEGRKSRQVLFLCSGNYYRSRMAEEIFNHLAEQAGLDDQAFSKGLVTNLSTNGNVGPIAPAAVSILESSGYPVRAKQRWPQTVSETDFKQADWVIALNLPEHQPMILARFPQYAARVTYWNIPDVGEMAVPEAFRRTQGKIQELIAHLSANPTPGV